MIGKTSVVLVAAVLFGVGPAEVARKETAKFQGTWAVTGGEQAGQKIDPDRLTDFELVVEGNKRTLKRGDQVVSESTFKVNASKTPKVMYVTILEGMYKGKTFPAIYEFDGKTQKVCIALNGIDPPASFSTEEGDGHLLQVYEKK